VVNRGVEIRMFPFRFFVRRRSFDPLAMKLEGGLLTISRDSSLVTLR
jgi:hypothetical protein